METQHKNNRKKQLVIALLTAALDFFHLGIVYPLFSELIANPHWFATHEAWVRSTIYAGLIAAFPFGQFLGSPWIGRLSDRFGRRRLLFFTVAGSGLGMTLCAIGVSNHSPWLIFAGRLIGGVMGANLSLAYAAIVDISTPATKVKNLALVPLATATGFALGPLMIGTTSNSQFFHENNSLPLWIAAAFSLINWLALWGFEETAKSKKDPSSRQPFLFWQTTRLWRPAVIVFMMIAANFLLVQFIGPYSVMIFGEDLSGVSWIYVNLSVSVSLGHLLLTRNLAGLAGPRALLPWSLGALAVSLAAILIAPTLVYLHLAIIAAMWCCAVAYTNVLAYLSDHADAQSQGEIMGLGVSIQCLAEWLPPIIVGAFSSALPALPMICGAIFSLTGIMLLPRGNRQKSMVTHIVQ
jgi:MFS transporter, DHA1 family, tetracycline resistance protein